MSQYNKTVLTHAGLELAKRANAGQAKFGITRTVTSADDWSNKTVQDLEEVTTIPNIMQQGIIMDTDEVESNNSVIGVSLCFTNKNLSTGYQIRIIGLYVKEEGQENDFLYAVTTAITPEYMPSFADKVLYRFNTQMYLVIGNAQSVNVVINEGTAVTHGQFDKYKAEVTGNLKKLENTHKEDMSHVAKSASINGGAEILPDSTGKLNLVVPDPDLSKYVSLEQLGELLQAKADVADVDSKIKAVTDLANTKANSADVYTKTETDNQINKFDLSKVKFRKQYINGDGQATDKTWSATKNDDGTYTIDLYHDDWTAAKLHDVLAQLPSKADASDVYTKREVDYAFGNRDNRISNLINLVKQIDGETVIENAVDVNTLVGTPNQVTVYKLSNVDNTNTPSWLGDHRGVMIVLNYDGNAKTQIWTPVGSGAFNKDGSFGWRYWEGNTPPDWSRLASVSYVDNLHNDLQNQINANNDRMNDINSNANGRLSLGGGNMNLRSTINWNGGEINDKTGNLGGINWAGGTDWAKIYGYQDDNDNLDLAIDLGDDGSNHVSFRKNGSETSAITSDGHFTGTVDWSNVSGRPDVATHADVNNKVNVQGDLFRLASAGNTWVDILGVANSDTPILVSIRDQGSGNLLGNYAAAIAFGGGDTKGVLNVAYSDHTARIIGGNGNAPVWHEDIAWKSDVNDLRNQIQQLRDNQFEVQTFTDATAAANWEAQRPGKRMAIVNS